MKMVDMHTLNDAQREQAAQMLHDEMPAGWPTMDDARQEVHCWLESQAVFAELDQKFRGDYAHEYIAALEGDEVLGWCGILPSYDGRVWELHPLVVRHDQQRKGIGTAIVRALEDLARARGGLTLWLGADDEADEGETSLGNADLYDDLPRRLRSFEPGTHPSAFYLKLGFQLIGVMPDANGPGKPDIFMAKRIA